MKHAGEHLVGVISIDATSDTPMFRQIYDAVRVAVLDGRLEAGLRLPSTRDLAERLGVSRNTIKSAFELLISEGYLTAEIGSGTRVTRTLPSDLQSLRATSARPRSPALPARARRFTGIQIAMPGETAPRAHYAFRSGMPAIDAFPFEQWGRLAARYYRQMPSSWSEASPLDQLGYLPLRRAMATYLKATRGVQCDAAQVIVTTGTQQGLYLVSQALLSSDDAVWIENPGYLGARHAFALSGAKLVPVSVDANGLDVDEGLRLAPNASAVYTTPSHQFPLGATLSLERRMALLRWAERGNAWIIEDDYDSEFRYTGYPAPALQGLDAASAGRVIYTGSFNKVLFPGLRLGFLVVPPALVGAFAGALEVVSGAATITNQVVLTTFIEEGHFQRHLRRMRLLYAERVAEFANQAARFLNAEMGAHDGGLHFALYLRPGTSEDAVVSAAAALEIDVAPLSRYAMHAPSRPGLLLGCCAVPTSMIAQYCALLGRAIDAR